jgi:hypothetical protein
MSPIPRTVLVLGAGFTKAFVPEAPLLIDDFGGKKLAKKFRRFPYAARVLDAEMAGRGSPEMNIERLMTRLDGRMPYDRQHQAESELAHLLTDLRKNFVERITGAKDETFHDNELARLARCCVENGINCVTFNYDDVFDQALWKVNPADSYLGTPCWHPNDGYGFFCRASYNVVESVQLGVDFSASMHLFKLHGSVNWRTKLGSPKPYGIDAVLHDESWYSPSFIRRSLVPHIQASLDPDPFIVPPVLVKSSLVEEPVLQYVWWQAYRRLTEAERVIFVGYSFPVTDMASRFLFSETLLRDGRPPDIRIVNLASTEEEKETVRRNYREVFPQINDDQFDFGGAREWSREFVAAVSAEKAESG